MGSRAGLNAVEKRYILPLRGIEPRFIGRPVRIQVTTLSYYENCVNSRFQASYARPIVLDVGGLWRSLCN